MNCTRDVLLEKALFWRGFPIMRMPLTVGAQGEIDMSSTTWA
jgi:hypothetical protein